MDADDADKFEWQRAVDAVLDAASAGSPLAMPSLRVMVIAARLANVAREFAARALLPYVDTDAHWAPAADAVVQDIFRLALTDEAFQSAISLDLRPFSVEGVLEDIEQLAVYPYLVVQAKLREDQLAATLEDDHERTAAERAARDEPYERRSSSILGPSGRTADFDLADRDAADRALGADAGPSDIHADDQSTDS